MLRHRPRRAVVSAALVLWLGSIAGMTAGAQPVFARCGSAPVSLKGSGSSWVALAMNQWASDVDQGNLCVTYATYASLIGRQNFAQGVVDFGASEIPYQPGELPAGKSYQYLPDVAGGTSLMYNLHTPSGSQIRNLNLNADAAAKIFTYQMTSWHDPEIQALNPGLQIAESTIDPVPRADQGSGTSAQFSLYLADQAPAVWNAFAARDRCPAPCQDWPAPGPSEYGTPKNGSDGITNFVAGAGGNPNSRGSIGYVEAGWAQSVGFPVANLQNASGHFVQPDAANVALALTHALLHPDLTQDLTQVYRAPEANAYPMSSYSYMITACSGGWPTCVGSSISPDRGAALGAFIIYIACSGQREAAPLRYSPIPPNLVQADFDAVRRIPGAPAPPPIDAAHCPNPTVVNPGALVASAENSGSGSSSNSNSASGSAGAGATAAPTAAASNAAQTAATAAAVLTSPSERLKEFNAARTAVAQVGNLGSSTTLYLAALAILVLAFGPVAIRRVVLLVRRR